MGVFLMEDQLGTSVARLQRPEVTDRRYRIVKVSTEVLLGDIDERLIPWSALRLSGVAGHES